MNKIMITGATGHLGSQVLHLLQQEAGNYSIYAIARDPSKLGAEQKEGITVIQADYEDKESLVKAFQGIDKLYFISGNDIFIRKKQHENVVEAAKEAGVKHVVYTSFQRKSETEDSPVAVVAGVHLYTEKLLKQSELNYTIMKHALYSDVIPMFIGEDVLKKGVIYQPAGDGKVSFASRSDMARAAVTVLTTEGHVNKVYEIAGNSSCSYGDIAKMLNKISGKQIVYISPSSEEFKDTLSKAGVPEGIIGMSVTFSEGIRQGEFDFPDPTLEKLIGHKPQSVEEFLTEFYSK